MDILAGLYGFKQGDYFAGFAGSVEAGLSHLGHVRNALQTMRDINVLDLQIYNHTVYFDDGTVVYVERCFNKYTAEVIVPIARKLQEGAFYWVPGCMARYDLSRSDRNCIINSEIADSKVLTATGSDEVASSQTSKTIDEAGLPRCGSSPGGLITREYRIMVLPGDSTETKLSQFASGLQYSDEVVPLSGPFTVSCLIRLNEKIKYDYSFTEKTEEINNGFVVYNPIKPRVLSSTAGETWFTECPGSIAPIIGILNPSRFSNHYVKMTNPWPSTNENFVSNQKKQIGYREIGSVCEDEPLLLTEYSRDSPYWDKVEIGSIETLEGEFVDFWEENTEINNAAPYASFCKFKVDGDHRMPIGTRVAGLTGSGDTRYATIDTFTCEYNEDGSIKNTTLTIKDYQYKLYINSTTPTLSFGSRPFPVCHKQGYMIGLNYIGLFFVNGNKILAGKLCDFENEYVYNKIMSSELNIGSYYHVCMTFDDSGNTALYLKEFGGGSDLLQEAQTTASFYNYSGFDQFLPYVSGGSAFAFTPGNDSLASDWASSWLFSANMEIGLPRFYKRALSQKEVQLLTQELFNGQFVADDFETEQLISKGFQPILV